MELICVVGILTGLVAYAVHKKGDVEAEISARVFRLRLYVKERQPAGEVDRVEQLKPEIRDGEQAIEQ